MATNTMLPVNPGGRNQTAPTAGGLGPGSAPQPVFTPAGGAQSAPSTNPYMSALPTGVGQTTGATVDPNLQKQMTDIFGKGVGGTEANLFQGMSGTNSAAFQSYLQSMAPVNAAQMANLKAQEGASGISANSSVDAIAASNLLAQQGAQASGVDMNMIIQNQQNQLGMMQGMQGAASQEVASSGWDVFGQVLGSLGQVGGEVLGAAGAAGGFSDLFGGAKKAASVIPSSSPGGSFTAPSQWF